MTRAVERLVAGTVGWRHVVYSMTRVGWRTGVSAMHYAPDKTALAYGDLPKGITLYRAMQGLAGWIENDLADKKIQVDIIHAHKMSTDAIVSYALARRRKIPIVCSIWGDADGKILGGRPDLRRLWREIADYASALLPLAPWTLNRFANLLRVSPAKMIVLPAIGNIGEPIPSRYDQGTFVSLFHLDHFRRKGSDVLAKAMGHLGADARGLDIFGGGTAKSYYDLEHLMRKSGAQSFVRLRGPLAAEKAQQTLTRHSALVMPSRRESFGMAYVEALFAGIPVLYPAGWAIDGFFTPERIGYACQSNNAFDVLNGLRFLLENELRLKRSIQQLQEAGELDIFRPENILCKYQSELRRAIET